MKEKDFQNKVIAFFKKQDITYYKTQGGMVSFPKKDGTLSRAFLKSDFADLLVGEDNIHYHIELKTDTGKLRDNQKEHAQKMGNKHGIVSFVLRPCEGDKVKGLYNERENLYSCLYETCERPFLVE